jgi:hypothetical protein
MDTALVISLGSRTVMPWTPACLDQDTVDMRTEPDGGEVSLLTHLIGEASKEKDFVAGTDRARIEFLFGREPLGAIESENR